MFQFVNSLFKLDHFEFTVDHEFVHAFQLFCLLAKNTGAVGDLLFECFVVIF